MFYVRLENNAVQENIPQFDPSFPEVPIEQRYTNDFLVQCILWEELIPLGWIYDEENKKFFDPEEKVITNE